MADETEERKNTERPEEETERYDEPATEYRPNGPGQSNKPEEETDVQVKEPEQPQDSQSEKLPQDSQSEKQAQDTQPEKPPQESQPEKPPEDPQSEKPPQESQPEQPPQDSQPEKPPQESQPEKPLQDSQPEKPPQESQPEKPPQESQPEKPPQDSQPEKPPQDSQPEKPPQESPPEKPPQESQPEKQPPDSQAGKPPQDSQAEDSQQKQQPQEEELAEKSQPPPTNQDALSMEFLYYGSVLKMVTPTLSSQSDRASVTPWIKKLFRPEYQATPLKDKRNRYLCALTCNLLNDEVGGIFQQHPPAGALADIDSIPIQPSTTAEWETDRMWQDTLLALPDDFEMMECSVHGSEDDCKKDHQFDKVLDQEFQFLLYLARPLAAMLPAEDKTRIAAWLQVLCSIHGPDACSSMKAIRNDYIMALLGYLNDLRVAGPFVDYPPEKLGRLDEAAKAAAEANPVLDPTGREANQFLLDQPVPDDGAFCYVALTGDLVTGNLG